ncbi:hypothetical protein HY524_01300 [Candidatus Berkelbacteria bacterium]|nr:hypothetical protein [Candidatus Berkelbacteria bacterium]
MIPESGREFWAQIDTEKEQLVEAAANEKLQVLMSPGFNNFYVRLVNIDEYEYIVTENRLGGEFTEHKDDKESFKSYIERVAANDLKVKSTGGSWGWADQVENSTQWPVSTHNLYRADHLYRLLRKARGFETGEVGRRQAWLNNIRQEILDYFEEEKNKRAGETEIAHLLNAVEHPSEQTDQRYDLENLEILRQFLHNDKFLVEQPDSLRKLLSFLVRAPLRFKRDRWGEVSKDQTRDYDTGRQYQLAIITRPILEDAITGHYGWVETQESVPADKFLIGAINLVPDKELLDRVIKDAGISAELAHPIFDHRGRVRWPKQSVEESPATSPEEIPLVKDLPLGINETVIKEENLTEPLKSPKIHSSWLGKLFGR